MVINHLFYVSIIDKSTIEIQTDISILNLCKERIFFKDNINSYDFLNIVILFDIISNTQSFCRLSNIVQNRKNLLLENHI